MDAGMCSIDNGEEKIIRRIIALHCISREYGCSSYSWIRWTEGITS